MDGENKGGEGETEEEKDGEMKDGGNEAAIDKNKDWQKKKKSRRQKKKEN